MSRKSRAAREDDHDFTITPEMSEYYKNLEEHRPLPPECWREGCPVPYESDEELHDRLQRLYDMGIDPYEEENQY